jgi:hypothetical protein
MGYNDLVLMGEGWLSEWADQDGEKNILFTPGALLDLVLRCT